MNTVARCSIITKKISVVLKAVAGTNYRFVDVDRGSVRKRL